VSTKENISALKKLVDHPRSLLSNAVNRGLPVAIWKLPLQSEVQMIVDLRPDIELSFDDLEKMPGGFAINPFHQHHPATPSLIKADLHLNWSLGHEHSFQAQLHPTVNDAQIDRLLIDEDHHKTSQRSESPEPQDDDSEYVQIVTEAIQQIKNGQFSKVVLSRYEDQSLPEGFDLFDFFSKASDAYPNAFTYILSHPHYGLWCGATPETLLSQDEVGHFRTVSLAGTQRLDDKTLSEVAWTQKEIEEQAMVSRYIIDCFKKIRLREFDEIGPKTVRAGNLAHLKTEYLVDTQSIQVEGLATTMMQLLHPTSAVCGMPLESSLTFIKDKEHYDRELYAGFMGPINMNGESHLFVNLRCMKLQGELARFYAGAGITEDSNPEKEYLETQMKMNTLKNLMFA
jgi:isochorismate synthase